MITAFALGLLLLVALSLVSKWYVSVEPQEILRAFLWVLLTIAMMIVVWLALSGRLLAAAGALPVVMLWLSRMFTGLRYAQMFKRMLGGREDAKAQSPAPGSSHMTRAQALQVLGLQEGASAAEIKAAHRRLMTHLHPDVGGSDFLAQQINQARDVLLG
jgi:hypothetical protein